MDPTDNHGYNRPREGAKNWDVDLNENFADIDSDMPIRDTEANKGTYDSTDGVKYEATDSGAIYYGNGDSWVLVDRRVNSLEAKRYYTVPEGTIQDIADAITSNRYVKLEPGAIYTAESEVRIEQDDLTEDTYVDARGTTLASEASDTVLHLRKTAWCADGLAKKITWRGGAVVGAGKSADSTGDSDTEAGIRITDCFGHDIRIGTATGVDKGIHVRNDECWSEALCLGYTRDGQYEDADTLIGGQGGMNYCVYMEGAGATGGTGTESFRGLRVFIPYGAAAPDHGEQNSYFYLEGSMHGGYLNIEGFLPENGYLIHCNGNLYSSLADIECEGGNDESRAIVHDQGPAPLYLQPRIGGTGRLVENNISGPVPAIDGINLIDLDEKKILEYDWGNDKIKFGYSIETQGPGSNYSGGFLTGRNGDEAMISLGKDTDDNAVLSTHVPGASTRSTNGADEHTVEHMMRGAHYDSQRSDPTTDELGPDETITYVSDGTTTGNAGDLVRAHNDGSDIRTQIIAALSDAD